MIGASSIEAAIIQNGAGTVMVLSVTVPAAPEGSAWHKRSIELNRDDTNSEWYVREGGEGL